MRSIEPGISRFRVWSFGPSRNDEASGNEQMRITILFGGTNKERLVSVASAQALHQALPEAELWFWHVADTVHEIRSGELLAHARPFEDEFQPSNHGTMLELALDRARAEDRV